MREALSHVEHEYTNAVEDTRAAHPLHTDIGSHPVPGRIPAVKRWMIEKAMSWYTKCMLQGLWMSIVRGDHREQRVWATGGDDKGKDSGWRIGCPSPSNPPESFRKGGTG